MTFPGIESRRHPETACAYCHPSHIPEEPNSCGFCENGVTISSHEARPTCDTCDDSVGLVPPLSGRGSDGPDPCPDCGLCTWCYGSGDWVESRETVPCRRCDGSGRKPS